MGQVITPNVYNMKLWETSGHAAHYRENMFIFKWARGRGGGEGGGGERGGG